MEDITYKIAHKKDLRTFYPLFEKSLRQLFPQYTPNTHAFFLDEDFSLKNITSRIVDKKNYLYLAFHDKEIAGFLLVKDSYGGVGFASWIAVLPGYQKRGIAGKLLQLWEENVRAEKGHALELWTSKNRVPFYKKRGFTLIGEFPQAWFGLDFYHFFKPLSQPEEKNYLRKYLIKHSPMKSV